MILPPACLPTAQVSSAEIMETLASEGCVNGEFRPQERDIRILPNRWSALRRVGALLVEQGEVWAIGNRHYNMTAHWLWHAQ